MENKVAQIQKETSRIFRKQIQVEEEEINTNSVFITVQKEVNPIENKPQKLLIDTPIINVILTNDRVKMNIHKRVMLLDKQEHQINILRNKQEEPPHKAIK